MKRSHSPRVHVAGLITVFCFLLTTAGGVAAQEATPSGAEAAHPVHVHEGTCADLNPAPQYPLNDIVPTAAAGSEIANSGSPIAVEMSTTTIDATLDDIANGDHAINVHESAENIANYIACGDIGGTIVSGTGTGGDAIAIGLHELNGSGHSGIAILQEAGDQLNITIYLAEGLSGGATTEADASPMAHSGHGATDTVQVDISNLAYNPETITITAGQSITWTNEDSTPHTVTGEDRDFLQSGTLNQGDTFTQTFDTPGTYEYFCEFHANMKGIIVVN